MSSDDTAGYQKTESVAVGRVSRSRLDACVLLAGAVLLAAVFAFSPSAAQDGGEMQTRNTVRLSLGWYTISLCLMMRLKKSDWPAETRLGRFTRWCWTWAFLCFLTHLATAFHYYHHWSHAHAYQITFERSGVGEGIYSLYFFVGIGLADALWWWMRPNEYAERSAWFDRVIHAFMLFIVFNGMIVFESGAVRWAGIVLFILWTAMWLKERGFPRL